MKKRIAFILALFLLLSALPSCIGIGSSQLSYDPYPTSDTEAVKTVAKTPNILSGAYLDTVKGIEPLYSDTVDEINEAWRESYNGTLFYELNRGTKYSDLYLGIVGGYVVVGFNDRMPVSPGTYDDCSYLAQYVSAAGYDFYVGGHNLYLYKDGVFGSDINKLYSEGKLSAEDVKTINYRYHEYVRYYNPDYEWLDKVPINEEELALINAAWEKRSGEIYAESLDKTTGARYCFGKFGENIVFKITGEKETNDFFTFEIDGVEFHGYNQEFEIWVLRDGELYTLADAYANGFITKTELISMSKYNVIAFYNEKIERSESFA